MVGGCRPLANTPCPVPSWVWRSEPPQRVVGGAAPAAPEAEEGLQLQGGATGSLDAGSRRELRAPRESSGTGVVALPRPRLGEEGVGAGGHENRGDPGRLRPYTGEGAGGLAFSKRAGQCHRGPLGASSQEC